MEEDLTEHPFVPPGVRRTDRVGRQVFPIAPLSQALERVRLRHWEAGLGVVIINNMRERDHRPLHIRDPHLVFRRPWSQSCAEARHGQTPCYVVAISDFRSSRLPFGLDW